MADTITSLAGLQALLADNSLGAISPQDIRDFLATAVPGARGPTLMVASSSADQAVQSSADYTCSGASDEVEINLALSALAAKGGGRVLLSGGTFTLAGSILVLSNCTLQGQGYSTHVQMQAATDNDAPIDAVDVDYWTVRDLQVSCAHATPDDLAYGIRGLATAGVTMSAPRVMNCWVHDCYDGILFIASGSGTIEDPQIVDNHVWACTDDGINVDDTDRPIILGNHSFSHTGAGSNDGIHLAGNGTNLNTDMPIIIGNHCYSNAGHGIAIATGGSIFTRRAVISNNVCVSNTLEGISAGGVTQSVIADNVCQGNSSNGIAVTATSDLNNIHGNLCRGNTDPDITVAAGAEDNWIHGNYTEDIIGDSDSGTRTRVENNYRDKRYIGSFFGNDFIGTTGPPTLDALGAGNEAYQGWNFSGANNWAMALQGAIRLPDGIGNGELEFRIQYEPAGVSTDQVGWRIDTPATENIALDAAFDFSPESDSVTDTLASEAAGDRVEAIITTTSADNFAGGNALRFVVVRTGATDSYNSAAYVVAVDVYFVPRTN